MQDSERLRLLHEAIDKTVKALDDLRDVSDLGNNADDSIVDISDLLRRSQNAARR